MNGFVAGFVHLVGCPVRASPSKLAARRPAIRPRVGMAAESIDSSSVVAATAAAAVPVAAALIVSALVRSRGGVNAANRGFSEREIAVQQAVLSVLPNDEYLARKSTASGAIEATGRLRDRTLTYGELDLRLLIRLLKTAGISPGDSLVDVGSGVGRVVLTAALLHQAELSLVTGVEILPELHKEAVAAEKELQARLGGEEGLIAKCSFLQKPYSEFDFSDTDVAVCYATTWASDGPILTDLSQKLGAELKPNARVITVDKQLRLQAPSYEFRLIGQLSGFNRDTTQSEGFVYKKIR